MKIDGIPEGWELVRIGQPVVGEQFIDGFDEVRAATGAEVFGCAIVRKLPEPLNLREGGWYERRDGEIVGPCKKQKHETYPYACRGYGYMNDGRYLKTALSDFDLIREVDPPSPTYRPFANAEEFRPERGRWIKSKDKDIQDERLRVTVYNDGHVFFNDQEGSSYQELLDEYVFENGEPCGVRVP